MFRSVRHLVAAAHFVRAEHGSSLPQRLLEVWRLLLVLLLLMHCCSVRVLHRGCCASRLYSSAAAVQYAIRSMPCHIYYKRSASQPDLKTPQSVAVVASG